MHNMPHQRVDDVASPFSCGPLVSVIMGVYRCTDFAALEQSIQSIISQTYSNWEFLIVDDGSDDNGRTYNAIKHIASQDNRIIALRYQHNHGLAYALNYCLSRAQGRYIARQDDDDYSEPERLEKQVSFLSKHPNIAICGSNATIFDSKGSWGTLRMPAEPSPDNFLWNSPFIHPSVIMRVDALHRVNGYRVSPETVQYEDYDLFMRMYAQGFRGVNLQQALYHYHSDRTVMKYRPMGRRIQEMKIRLRGFHALGLGIRSFPFAIKPVLVALIPHRIYSRIQRRRFLV
jgi:glycosyltransferase EpsE